MHRLVLPWWLMMDLGGWLFLAELANGLPGEDLDSEPMLPYTVAFLPSPDMALPPPFVSDPSIR